MKEVVQKAKMAQNISQRKIEQIHQVTEEIRMRRAEGNVTNREDYDNLPEFISGLSMVDNCCNEVDFMSFDVSSFSDLCNISVGSYSCRNVDSLTIEGLLKLESVEIGEGSFTLCGSTPNTCTSNAFIISNCPKLKSISIGAKSFIDWGEFQLLSRSAKRE